MDNVKGVLFDLDGTLSYNFAYHEKEGQPIPGVIEVLERLKAQKVSIDIVTNQAGPLYQFYQDEIIRLNPWWKRKDYPTVEQLARSMTKTIKELNLQDAGIYIAVWDERIRPLLMPSGEETMGDIMSFRSPRLPIEQAEQIADLLRIRLAEAEQDITAKVSAEPFWRKPEPGMIAQAIMDRGYSNEEVIYCGDMDSDKQAAENAGVRFLHASRIAEL